MIHIRAVLLGDKRTVKLADAGLAALMHIDYMAAKSNVGPFSWTVSLTAFAHASSGTTT